MSDKFEPLRARGEATAEVIAHILDGFRGCTLPKEEWTHAAHFSTAVMLIDELGLAGAEAEMPGMIRAYNLSVGGVNSDTEGYHHTITIFLLRKIDEFLRNHRDTPLPERITALLASPLIENDYLSRFYSEALLFSLEARRSWVEPGL